MIHSMGLPLKILRYTSVFFLGGVMTLLLATVVAGLLYAKIVGDHAGMRMGQLLSIVRQADEESIVQTDGRKNILILGIDALETRDRDSILTDTIMVASIDIHDGVISTFSFPRDLYITSHSAKINALYHKAVEEGKAGDTYIRPTVEALSGIPIHTVIVLDIATVAEIIDAFGGLDIEIERSFVDYRYPNPTVDVRTERDPNKLYDVLSFTKGVEHMNGDRALRFIRSRHSPDPIEGTDDARVRRQQKVIAALLSKLKDPTIVRNPEQIGKLIGVYNEHFNASLPLTETVAMARVMIKNHKTPEFKAFQFAVQANGNTGQIYHPERHASGAWVYLPVDPSYQQLRDTVHTWLSE